MYVPSGLTYVTKSFSKSMFNSFFSSAILRSNELELPVTRKTTLLLFNYAKNVSNLNVTFWIN